MIQKTKAAVDATLNLIDGVRITPEGAEAQQELGRSALTVTKAINNVLLPIAAVNFGFEKAKEYFENRFATDFKNATKNIPPAEVVEPKASVAAPALQGLGFRHQEPNIKQMYLNLLRTAVDRRSKTGGHPSFSEIIKQLSAEEAGLLLGVLAVKHNIPIVDVWRVIADGKGEVTLERHVLNLVKRDDSGIALVHGLAAMVDNWSRLGLVEVDYTRHLVKENAYTWARKRPEYLRHLPSDCDGTSIERVSDLLCICDLVHAS